jgi:ABC-type nitrate/sulfonate/bicarbonate transport system substrate-binding protein
MNKKRHKLLAAVAAPVLLMTASACGVGNAQDSNGSGGYETTTIRYQSSSGGVIDLAEVADALDYLGPLELERLGDVQGGPESLRAVATGQVDYGGAFNGAVAKLTATGAPLKAVISYYGSSGDVDSSLLTLEDSKIMDPEDLVGKKVAVNTLGANAEAVLDTYLREGGLSDEQIDQVTLVPLPGISIEQALRQRQVEAAYLFGALKEMAVERGGVRSLVTDTDLVGPYNAGSYVLREDFIQRNPRTTEKFVGALAKALRYTQQQPLEKVRGVLATYLEEHGRADQVESLELWRGTGVSSPGGVIRDEDYELWLDWLEAEGEVEPGSIEVPDIYTNEFNPYAEEADQ